jgi:predicted DCC family thiol-disulfide oxidoreductase YuxK
MPDVDLDEGPILLFDGVCNLCNGIIQFIIKRDPEGRFRYAPLQSEVAKDLLRDCGLPTDRIETFVMIDEGECYTKSSAAIRIATKLGGFYRVAGPFRYIPRPIRDSVYDLVAATRYDIFGRKDQCMVPTPDIEDRFLD